MRYYLLSLLLFFAFNACSNSQNNTAHNDPFTNIGSIASLEMATVASGVATNSHISLHFLNAIDTSTLTATSMILQRVSDDAVHPLSTIQYDLNGTTNYATLIYKQEFYPKTTYRLTLTTDITSYSIPLDQNYSYEFTTGDDGDITPPTLGSSTPTTSDTNASSFTSIKLNFSEGIDHIFSGTDYILTDSNTTQIPVTVKRASSFVMIVPQKMLDANASYTLTYPTISDLAGNTLAGGSVSFTTQQDIVFTVSDSSFTVKEGFLPWKNIQTGAMNFFFVDTNNSVHRYEYNGTLQILTPLESAGVLNDLSSLTLNNDTLYAIDDNNGTKNIRTFPLMASISSSSSANGINYTDMDAIHVKGTRACITQSLGNTTYFYTVSTSTFFSEGNSTLVVYPNSCFIDSNSTAHVFSDTQWKSFDINSTNAPVAVLDVNISDKAPSFIKASTLNSSSTTIIISKRGDRWVFGGNAFGTFGDGTTLASTTPIPIDENHTWAKIISTGSTVGAIDVNGSLWLWGNNSDSQIGNGSTSNVLSPYNLLPGTTWSDITAGDLHSVGIKTDGTLWGWGSNLHFESTANNSTLTQTTPLQIGVDTNWTQVKEGTSRVMALKNGTLWGWGYNNFNQTSGDANLSDIPFPTQIGTDSNWTDLFVGQEDTIVKKIDGSIWGFGRNGAGELGMGTSGITSLTQIGTATDWKSVSIGLAHSLALKNDGTLWVAGANDHGQLGYTTGSVSTFTQIAPEHKWKVISAISNSSMAIAEDDTVWVWGANTASRLGLGDTIDRYAPTSIPTGLVMATIEANDYLYTLQNSSIKCYEKQTGALVSSYDLNETVRLDHIVLSGGFAFVSAAGRAELYVFDLIRANDIRLYRVLTTTSPITGLTLISEQEKSDLLIGHAKAPNTEMYDVRALTSLSYNSKATYAASNAHNAKVLASNGHFYVGSDTNITIFDANGSLSVNSVYPSNGNIVSLRSYIDYLGTPYLIVSKGSLGVDIYQVFDTVDPVTLTFKTNIPTIGNVQDAIGYNTPQATGILYVGTTDQGIHVYNIATITVPSFVQTYTLNSPLTSMEVTSAPMSTLYIADVSNTISYLMIDDINGSITFSTSVATSGPAIDMFFDSSLRALYAAVGAKGIDAFDCSTSSCSYVSTTSTPGYATRIDAQTSTLGGSMYVADYTGISLFAINASSGMFMGLNQTSHLPSIERIFDVAILPDLNGSYGVGASNGVSTLLHYTLPVKIIGQ